MKLVTGINFQIAIKERFIMFVVFFYQCPKTAATVPLQEKMYG